MGKRRFFSSGSAGWMQRGWIQMAWLGVAWCAAMSTQAAAQKLPKTADGHPDLQGIWTNSTLTPLERPGQFAGKAALTETEAAAYEKSTVVGRDRDKRDADPNVDVGRAYNELFFDQGTKLARLDGTIRTAMIVDPPDGHIPALTPEAEKRQEAARTTARMHPADGPENRSLAERCLFWATAGPPMLPGPYNNTYQIVQAPGYVAIRNEMNNGPKTDAD